MLVLDLRLGIIETKILFYCIKQHITIWKYLNFKLLGDGIFFTPFVVYYCMY